MEKFSEFIKEEKQFKPKAKRQKFHFGTEITGVEIELISDLYGGEVSDTEVNIVETGTICTIAGDTIDLFKDELQFVIDKYKI